MKIDIHQLDELFTEQEAAAKLNKSPITLRNWRSTGRGPRYFKIGSSVKYSGRDLKEYQENNHIDPAKRVAERRKEVA